MDVEIERKPAHRSTTVREADSSTSHTHTYTQHIYHTPYSLSLYSCRPNPPFPAPERSPCGANDNILRCRTNAATIVDPLDPRRHCTTTSTSTTNRVACERQTLLHTNKNDSSPITAQPPKGNIVMMTLSTRLREWRHNPCLMKPLTACLLFVVGILWTIVMLLKFPTLILGMAMAPCLQRFQWVVQFWYPTAIGKWVHLTIVRMARNSRGKSGVTSSNDANRGYHCRASETRVEVVPGRVFVHPLPQLLDNLGYLVVCLPEPKRAKASSETRERTNLGNIQINPSANAGDTEIVAFVVDCGEANAVTSNVEFIRKRFYKNRPIQVQSILSTHKHHDHTAGNLDLLEERPELKLIFGGAVEQVPYCNFPLANGDKLPLPKAGHNDMSQVVEVEAVATPAHTRGSLTYVLRPLTTNPQACLFTGDTVFSGGGGVSFEADIDPGQETKAPKMTANSYIKASAAANAVERCFAEVLFRSVPTAECDPDHLMVFPGHEYTNELLTRQLTSSSSLESCRWKNFAPSTFFQTMSQFYVSLHRRSLPHSSGKILSVPSTIQRELFINPHFRNMKQRGVIVIQAIQFWNKSFAKKRASDMDFGPAFPRSSNPYTVKKTRPLETEWNLDVADLNRQVFTTVYVADLDTVIDDLNAGRIDGPTAASRLQDLKSALDKNVIGRRPVPGTLPSSRIVYRGLLGLALLGSAPTALAPSDSETMKLPAPVDTSSDRIVVSKKRLISVLYWLGLLNEDDGKMTLQAIHQLWKETYEYSAIDDPESSSSSSSNPKKRVDNSSPAATDVESVDVGSDDEVELGSLKWVLYGIPSRRPKTWLTMMFCAPCLSPKDDDQPSIQHRAGRSGMERHGGELVRHDVMTCPLCRDATGCPHVVEQHVEQIGSDDYRHGGGASVGGGQVLQISSSTNVSQASEDYPDDESSAFIEVAPALMKNI